MVYYELKKILIKTGSKIVFVLLAAVVVLLCYMQTHEKSSDICSINEYGHIEIGFSSSRKLREAQKEWSGPLSEDNLLMALNFLKQHSSSYERQGANQIRALLNRSYQKKLKYSANDYYNAEKIEPSQLSHFYENREALMYQWLYDDRDPYNNGYYLYTENEKEFLMERIRTIETPFWIDYVVGWNQASKAAAGISMIGIIILGFLLTGIFTDEFRWKADAVFFSTPFARKQAVKAKIKVGFLVTTILYWGAILPSGFYLLAYFGFDGADCPIQVLPEYWFSIYHLNMLQRYVLIAISNYLGWLFTASMIMMLSTVCKYAAFPVIVPILLNIVPMWLLGDSDFLPEVLMLFPSSLFSLFIDMTNNTVYTVGGVVTTAGPIIIPLYALLTLLFTWIAYHIFCCKQLS